MTDPKALACVARLQEESELAPPVAVLSSVAGHFDRGMALILDTRDPAVVRALLARASEPREVLRAKPPHLPVEGGYGLTFGHITVADKARFALERLVAPAALNQLFENAEAASRLRWGARDACFVVQ